MRIATLALGVLTVATGIWAFANSGVTFLALAFVIGLVLLLDGIIEGSIYIYSFDRQKGNNTWMVADSALTVIAGLVTLNGTVAAEVAMPYLYGMWLMAAGVNRISVSFNINRERKLRNFVWAISIGILMTLGGAYCVLNDRLFMLSTGMLVGIMVIIKGLATLEIGLNMPHAKVIEK